MAMEHPMVREHPQAQAATRLDRLPPLVNIVPSIFVPVEEEEDITQAIDLPRSRVEKLRRTLKTIESQRACVKENMIWLFERERDRILAEAQEMEELRGVPDVQPGLPPDEVDWMISNMEAAPKPGIDYNVQDMRPAAAGQHRPGVTASHRKQAAFKLAELAGNATAQIQGYDKHMDHRRNYYLGTLEREIQKVDAVGQEPEGRAPTEHSKTFRRLSRASSPSS